MIFESLYSTQNKPKVNNCGKIMLIGADKGKGRSSGVWAYI
jgi:hypothetical protein